MRDIDIEAFPAPSGRDEAWRFTPLSRLRLDDDAPADGKVVVEHHVPDGAECTSVDRDDPRFGSVLEPADRVTATAMARFERGTCVTVPAGTRLTDPVHINVRGEGGRAYGHLLVDVGDHAEAVVVIDHGGSAHFNANAEYRVGAGGRLTVVSLQDWDDDSIHLGTHAALVGRDATFRSVHVTFGGEIVRLLPQVRFAGPGGDAELLGLFFADAGQHLEHRLLVDHNEPHCRSRVVYKGALQGEAARTVWIGDVVIRGRAVGTDTYELNRNLILTDGARADSVPNLEIETGEVVHAGHASATGRFDDLQLFYLMSRGIPPEEARRLVVRGFFADVIGQIEVPALRERLTDHIEAELQRSVLA